MKKTLFTATLLAASLMAASTVQAAPQEVTMWHYFDQKPEQEMLADMVEEYNSLQDDIHINATFVSRTELMNQYTVGALSGELPDIGQVDSPDMESYISLGVFEDITDELESWGELDQFYDGPLSSCKDPDGKVYGLPQNSNCLALACNMDLLKAAGYDHMPQSLDEFKEMVAATTDASNDVYGFAMCAVSTEEGTFQILPWLRSVQNGTGVNVDNITADSAVNGLQTLGDFVANGYMSKECVNWTQADAWNQFCAGKAAFAECGTWHLAQTDEAARLDGCGSVKAFLMVMLPAVKTGIITIMVISFLNGWNDLVYSMTFNVAEIMRPLTANIYKFQSAYGTRWNCIMAYGAILVLPVILMFIFLQKYIVGGLVAGAVKD